MIKKGYSIKLSASLQNVRLNPSVTFSTIQAFHANDLSITRTNKPKTIPKYERYLRMGLHLTDHMFEVDWEKNSGWLQPKIVPYHSFQIDPCNLSLHYAIECFEGLKAFYGTDGKVRLFRPDMHLERFRRSCQPLHLPEFDPKELLECIRILLKTDEKWIPTPPGFSIYIRPVAMAMTNVLGVRAADKSKIFVVMTPAGPSFPDGFRPLKLFVEHAHSRSYYGGTAHLKIATNYSATVKITRDAEKKGFHSVLWLSKGKISEIGSSNFFYVLKESDNSLTLITPPDDGLILPGIMRDSVINIAKSKGIKVEEKHTDITDFLHAVQEKRILEAFGSSTTNVLTPIKLLHYKGIDYELPVEAGKNCGPVTNDLSLDITNIQYGVVKHPWGVFVDK